MPVFIECITIDCHNPETLSEFWANALGYRFKTRDAAWSLIEDANGVGPEVGFQRVPEEKIVKNRVHLDLAATSATLEEEKQRLLTLGASVDRLVDEAPDTPHYIMRDPEGNEFCLMEEQESMPT